MSKNVKPAKIFASCKCSKCGQTAGTARPGTTHAGCPQPQPRKGAPPPPAGLIYPKGVWQRQS